MKNEERSQRGSENRSREQEIRRADGLVAAVSTGHDEWLFLKA